MAEEEELETWAEAEDELREFVLDELDGYLEDEELEEELQGLDDGTPALCGAHGSSVQLPGLVGQLPLVL